MATYSQRLNRVKLLTMLPCRFGRAARTALACRQPHMSTQPKRYPPASRLGSWDHEVEAATIEQKQKKTAITKNGQGEAQSSGIQHSPSSITQMGEAQSSGIRHSPSFFAMRPVLQSILTAAMRQRGRAADCCLSRCKGASKASGEQHMGQVLRLFRPSFSTYSGRAAAGSSLPTAARPLQRSLQGKAKLNPRGNSTSAQSF